VTELFGEKSFALLFVLLLGVSALPPADGGATHVFEVIAILLAVQLLAGRDEIWLPPALAEPRAGRSQAAALHHGAAEDDPRLERFSRHAAELPVRPPA
jgi:hypothetical protein